MMKTNFIQWFVMVTLVSTFGMNGCDGGNDDDGDMSSEMDTVTDTSTDTAMDTAMDTATDTMSLMKTLFRVNIRNISDSLVLGDSGTFSIPDGAVAPAPAFPGDSYSFSFFAGMEDRLSLATMFVHSNDWILATPPEGIPLFDQMGTPVTGDVTAHVKLYDVGTEINQPIGEGGDQPVRQSGPNTGEMDANAQIRMLNPMDVGAPPVEEVIRVLLSHEMGMFTIHIENISTDMTIELYDMSTTSAPVSPGVYAIHTGDVMPLFTLGAADGGHGLEDLAEDGDPSVLAEYLLGMTGPAGPIAPGVFVVHHGDTSALFTEHQPDMSHGLEALAEDGNPEMLQMYLSNMFETSGAFNMPVGKTEATPAFPGDSYSFTFEASAGDYLSFATMLVKSNDLFFSPMDKGLALFSNGTPVVGDVTDSIHLWDAGTEVNEVPGFGPNQPLNQTDSTAPITEMGQVMMVDDGFFYPEVNRFLQVTISIE